MQDKLTAFLLMASQRRVSIMQGQAIALIAVMIATLARIAASALLGTEVSFVLVVPAVLLTTFFSGLLGGLTAILAGSALDLLIASGGGHLSILKAMPRLVVWLSSAIVVMAITCQLRAVLRTLIRREEALLAAETRRQLLIHELEHRGRNALTIVQALSRDVARSASSVTEYRDELAGRLSALATSYRELTSNTSRPIKVAVLVREVLKPFGRQIKIDGGFECTVSREVSLPLSLALHELATNATKYGALSRPSGEVTINWAVTSGGYLNLNWSELGGPRPIASTPEGFGSTLLRTVFREAPGGAFKAQWRPEGMAFSISTQLAEDDGSAPAGAEIGGSQRGTPGPDTRPESVPKLLRSSPPPAFPTF